jgi:hypothetical protein
VGGLLDNSMTFALNLENPGNFSVRIECNQKMIASASFDIEIRSSGRVLSLTPSLIPGVDGVAVSAVLIDVLRPLSCAFGRLFVKVESFDNSTLTCLAPMLPAGKLAFWVVHSLGSTPAIGTLVVAPPQVTRVDHVSFGVVNRSFEIKVYLQSHMNQCNEMSCIFSGMLTNLSDLCTCQVFCNSSMSTFELLWRNVSIFTKSIPGRVVPRYFHLSKESMASHSRYLVVVWIDLACVPSMDC